MTMLDFLEKQTDDITSKGAILNQSRWFPIEVVVSVEKTTEKALFGNVTVYHGDNREEEIFSKESWVPKTMSSNPWWIITQIFNHKNRVSNSRRKK